MPLFFVDENYNDSSNVNANAGNWVVASIEFLHIVQYTADSLGVQFNVVTAGGVRYYQIVDGSQWSDYGFVGGAEVVVEGKVLDGDPWGFSFIINIDYLDGDKLFLVGTFTGDDSLSYPRVDDLGNQIFFQRLTQRDRPQGLEFDFNLTRPDSPTTSSVIDGSINRLKYDGLNVLGVGDEVDLEQIGDKSGGYIIRPKLTYVSFTDGYRRYKVSFIFMQWAFLQAGFAEPEYLEGTQTLGVIANARVFSQLGNPNSILQDESSNNDGNVGGFNENYNTGVNPYTLNSVVFTSGVLEIDAIDYCGTTHFKAEIQGPDFDAALSAFTIGLTWRTVDEENYYNKLTDFGQNTATLAPVDQFTNSLVPDPALYNGNVQPDNGMQWAFQNLIFTISGAMLTVEGDILPIGTNEEAFDPLGVGEKKMTLWVSHSRGDIPNSLQKKTSIVLHDRDAICAPPAPTSFVVSSVKYTDHGDFNITGVASLTETRVTTEDDSRYAISFNLVQGNVYESLTHKVSAYNTITGANFKLEELGVDFTSFPYVDGKHEIYSEQSRSFNLPPSTNKNVFELNRNPDADLGSLYELYMNYGFLSMWQTWLALIGANDEFYNPLEQNNGLNKDWQHYSAEGNWVIRMTTSITSADALQTYVNDFEIRPYDDEDAATVVTFINLEDGSTPTTLIDNTFMEVTATITWFAGAFDNISWAEATIEDFEGANRWVISSYLEHEGVTDNPLQPIDGFSKLSLDIMGSIAVLKYVVNTNIVDAENVSLSHRIFSNPQGVGFGMLTEAGDELITEDGVYFEFE